MPKRIQSFALLLAFAAGTVVAAPAVQPKPDPDDGRLVEYEVTLRQMPASDSVGVLQRVAAAHHGMVTRVDVDGRRAYVSLPADRSAGLKDDPLVTATPSTAPSSSRRIDHLKPVTMTKVLWDSGTYGYDGAGNITNIGGDVYQYDAVNRLTDAKVQGAEQAYTYDAFGNRLTASLLDHRCARGMNCAIVVDTDSATNRLRQTTIMTASEPVNYDDAGNVTYFAGTTFEYDALGNMVGRNDGNGSRFVYDANDERVGWHEGTGWKWTLRDVTGRQLREYTTPTQSQRTMWGSANWTWTRDHIYRGDQVLASVTPSQTGEETQYLHLDHLGTPRVITQDNRQVALKTFYPFGAEQGSAPVESPAENHKFTGHEFDDVNNGKFDTDYMHARYYNATAGRFLSVDPTLDINKNLYKPQGWNRYSYVRNNPLNLVDADGRADGVPGCAYRPCGLMTQEIMAEAAQDSRDVVEAARGMGPDASAGERLMGGGVIGAIAAKYIAPFLLPGEGEAVLIAENASKTDVLASLRGGAGELTRAQRATVIRQVQRATTGESVSVIRNADGTAAVLRSRPGKNGSQTFVTTVGRAGTSETVQTARDAAGQQVHYDPKGGRNLWDVFVGWFNK